jgi:hypothetical protein
MKQKLIFSIEYRSIVLLIYLLVNHCHIKYFQFYNA